MNNKGQERPKCFSIPYDFGSPSSRPRPRACPSMTHAQARGGDGVSHHSHVTGSGAGSVRYGIGKDAVSGKGIGERTFTGVRSRIWCYHEQSTEYSGRVLHTRECSRGRAVRTHARPRGVCIDYMIRLHRGLNGLRATIGGALAHGTPLSDDDQCALHVLQGSGTGDTDRS